ncbi:uncharacterized protein TRAVEDRAFT_60523 [Trametes versicolor FP-101664 SS1]|uniref:uncharacterized protein n=1 Tax=Trametes versicolor (strain FP-101664) TaxID=717944 RepID=UPI000462488A|nr:uncharacterized protein TRAVEDRAFT_60523 [Trametes versicolor FP-101664 SS1]EIW53922.1 hypothetical protein TRAVEDRAFT_60523 [Trametes versicolor FP-101664 SS1]
MASTASDAALDTLNVVDNVRNVGHRTMNTPCKGKTAKSWLDLPAEIVRLIATHYLLDVYTTGFYPQTWEAPQLWPQRFAFTTLRDAREFERVMDIFPTWKPHLEHHLFWNKACAVLDPLGALNHLSFRQPPSSTAGSNNSTTLVRVSMYHHFHSLLGASCAVCRINMPYNSEGVGAGSHKRSVSTQYAGTVLLCKDHRKATAFCGVCLREAPRAELEEEYTQGVPVGCLENEDHQTWPNVETTCRSCRAQVFWLRVSARPEWRQAVSTHRWATLDWETRTAVENFIDLGEGTIQDVLQLAEEKHWLRSYTKLGDMLQQALASSRLFSRTESGDAFNSDEELSEDETDDPEMLSLTEEGVKDIAINDWARNRILDGHWISPADDWFHYTANGRPRLAPAVHPCPWNRQTIFEGALDEGQSDDAQVLEHPRPKTHLSPHPPSYTLCEMTYRTFSRQMGEILGPAMRNIVRKIVMECAADGTDPAVRANRMTLEDVMRELRDESSWYNGIDWLERRANERLAERRRAKERDEDDSSSSSHSTGSHTTSPVLSTTTLQTTPSPPPSGKEDDALASSPMTTAPPVLTSPLLKSPDIIRMIPYVPVTAQHLPYYSIEAFGYVWREACAPLYQCQCSICERAMLNVNLALRSTVPTQAQLHPSAVAAQVSPPTNPTPPVQIKIQDAPLEPELAVVQGDEDDLDGSEDESLDEDGESERGDVDGDGDDATSLSLSLSATISVPDSDTPASEAHGTPQVTATTRKRPSTELDNDAFDELHPGVTFPTSQPSERGGTPPKRARRHGSFDGTLSSPAAPTPVGKATASLVDSPSRQRKRSSEELELVDREAPGSGKRMRSDDVADAPLPSVEKSNAVSPPPVLRTAQLDVRPERRASAAAGVVQAN